MTNTRTDTVTLTTPTDREVVITRVFDAPRDLVFQALTRPDLLQRWMTAPGRSFVVCDIDLRVNGAYRFVWSGPGKKDVGMHGVYQQIVPPESIVNTEAWEDWDAGETLVTTHLAELDGKTTFTNRMVFSSREVRDAILSAGMADGAEENYAKLADLLRTMQLARASA